jgi:DMSO reductase anchor subunit
MVLMIGSLIVNTGFGTVLPEWMDSLLFVVLMLAVHVSVTIAITRYQLYEIDRIISRTLSYTLLIALLAVVFVGIVAVVGAFLPSDDPLAIAASTLAIAAVFNPLRRRVQQAVDRRFNRSGYLAEVVSAQFAAKLQEPLSTQQITALWSQTVEDAMRPQAAGIWLRET